MNLTNEEIKALQLYFETTTIDITKLSRKIGVKEVKHLSKAVDKILDHETNS